LARQGREKPTESASRSLLRRRTGFFQIFMLPKDGSRPQQVTFDRTHKRSQHGRRMAVGLRLRLWSYDVQFWMAAR
jgi:hypothetical protein